MYKKHPSAVPYINVTPLIDVLLVLLIIFMVVSPLKPSRINVQIPSPPAPDDNKAVPHALNLVVSIRADRSIELIGKGEMGTVTDTGRLSTELAKILEHRRNEGVLSIDALSAFDVNAVSRIQRTVFVRAPRAISYGDVAKVIDAIKGAGADPVGLQINKLD